MLIISYALEAEGESKEVVVKLLYNYYASSTDQDGQPLSTSPDQWTLLHEQRRREINLRPPGRHPNIVPILRDFFDRVPSSGKEATLERVEDFPEGFGRKAHTYYFVMPRQNLFFNITFILWFLVFDFSSEDFSLLFSCPFASFDCLKIKGRGQ